MLYWNWANCTLHEESAEVQEIVKRQLKEATAAVEESNCGAATVEKKPMLSYMWYACVLATGWTIAKKTDVESE